MKRRPGVDLSLYLIADPAVTGVGRLIDIVRAAVAGGVTTVQLRDKLSSTRSLIDTARRLKEILQPRGVPLIINDRLDVALVVRAEGIHVGQDDVPADEARRFLGESSIIGLTVRNLAEARDLDVNIVDYAGIGPIRATQTKSNTAAPKGIEGFQSVRREVQGPAVAIGGIDADIVRALIEAGADGVAVVSAICAAADPEQAARALAAGVAAGRSMIANQA